MAENRVECGAAGRGDGGSGEVEEMVVVVEEEQPKEIMLFGVRVVVDSMRKVVSHNNLTDYQHTQDNHNHEDEDEDVKAMESGVSNKESGNSIKEEEEEDVTVAAGYTSADDAVHQSSSASASRSERKRGVPWTEEEHRRFLVGLKKMGKGDWRRIARNFVKTRTPTQVASHAQKYYMRQQNMSRRRRRSSLFDITTDTVATAPMEKQQAHQQDNKSNTNASQSNPLSPLAMETRNISNFPVMPAFPIPTASHAALPFQYGSPIMENQPLKQGNQFINHLYTNVMHPVPFFLAPCTPTAVDLSLRLKPIVDSSPLLLKLSSPPDQRESSSRHFQERSNFNNEDKIIIVS